MNNETIISNLFTSNPYESFECNPDAFACRQTKAPLFESLIKKVSPKIIIEVGSWRGSTAIWMASIVKKLNLNCVIICIDTWLGSPEHWLQKGGGIWGDENLNRKHGYPQLYYTFLNNIMVKQCHDVIVPLPLPSESAIKVLERKKIMADLIYIDAAHEFEPVYRDIKYYWERLNPDGILFGDDYIGWDGVTQAANQFAQEVKKPIFGKLGKFVIPKGDYKIEGLTEINIQKILKQLVKQ